MNNRRAIGAGGPEKGGYQQGMRETQLGPRLIVIGGLNMDLIVRVPRLPRPGETISGGPFRRVPGGKGANQAVAAARLGAEVGLVGRVGRDAFGRELTRALRAEGIRTNLVRAATEPTGVALIVVDEAGENSIAVASGANRLLRPTDLPADLRAAGDVLVAPLENPLETQAHALRAARAAGVRTVLNTAPAQPLPAALLANADVLIANEHELAVLLGRPNVPPGAEAEAARALRASAEQVVVVTLGERGALAVRGDSTVEQPAFAVEIVDTTAAGDAFVAAFAHAYWPGEHLAVALRRACAAGALTCTRPGAQPALPTAAAVAALLDRGHERRSDGDPRRRD